MQCSQFMNSLITNLIRSPKNSKLAKLSSLEFHIQKAVSPQYFMDSNK